MQGPAQNGTATQNGNLSSTSLQAVADEEDHLLLDSMVSAESCEAFGLTP